MQKLPCECPERDWSPDQYWKWQPCAFCEEAARLDGLLWRELNLKPWEFPAIENPAAENPYPAGSYAAERWGSGNQEAQARWKALARASREARRAGRRG